MKSIKGNFGLKGSSISIALTERLSESRTHVVICESEDQASQIAMDLKSLSSDPVLYLPDPETLAYDLETPHASLRGQRCEVLTALSQNDTGRRFFISSESVFAKYVANQQFWDEQVKTLKKGDRIQSEAFTEWLIGAGYQQEKLDVASPGDFTQHNNVIDVFSVHQESPIRIEINQGCVDDIYRLDTETLRNNQSIDETTITPAYELPVDESALNTLKSALRTHDSFSRNDPVFQSIQNKEIPHGIEYYLPVITSCCLAIDLIQPHCLGQIVWVDRNPEKPNYWRQIEERFEDVAHEQNRVILPPHEVWMKPDHLKQRFFDHAIEFDTYHSSDELQETPMVRQPSLHHTINRLLEIQKQSQHLIISLSNTDRIDETESIVQMMGLKPVRVNTWAEVAPNSNQVSIFEAPLKEGFLIEGLFSLITEKEVFGNTLATFHQKQLHGKTTDANRIHTLEALEIGDPLVHMEYGVGRYAGLETIDMVNQTQEMLRIRYAEDTIAFVGMDELYLVTRHGGLTDDKIPLDHMESKKWRRKLNNAVAEIQMTARTLVDLKKQRNQIKGIQCQPPSWRYYRFANGFSFETTRDQQQAINDILDDLQQQRPMDRLVVGDVGFGKTEVAMRGAFLSLENGYHVIVAAPTHILARQHYESFLSRFEDQRFEIVEVTDDQSGQRRVEKMLQSDAPKVFIGTNRILRNQSDISRVGLLIIDEEHRFGTRDKEMLAEYHGQMNLMNMTATPIPRTLSLSLTGIRDISIISTPPSRRLSIRTMVKPAKDGVYREAIKRELSRGGQVYVLHNSVADLSDRVDYLQALFPEARITTLHGQMGAHEQARVLSEFSNHQYDILVCTTVIENGIDIPRANTILIEKPDRLGLSQLHQIRGRVGRSYHQAYCYLIEHTEFGTNARKRFDALIRARNLGDGFLLANHDLEIRGAGELLGEQQSGQIHAIGFSLYSKLLQRAIDLVEQGRPQNELVDRDRKIDLNLSVDAMLPNDYINEPSLRLTFYKRLASSERFEEIDLTRRDIRERFGPMPQTVSHLCIVSKMRIYCRLLMLKKVVAQDTSGFIEARNREQGHSLEQALEEVVPEFRHKSRGFQFFYPMSDPDKRFHLMIRIMQHMTRLETTEKKAA